MDAPDDRLLDACGWVIHAGLGAATLLRGGLPLHGSALMGKGRLFCLMAEAGMGKSAVCWHFIQNGFALALRVPVYEISYRRSFEILPELATALLHCL